MSPDWMSPNWHPLNDSEHVLLGRREHVRTDVLDIPGGCILRVIVSCPEGASISLLHLPGLTTNMREAPEPGGPRPRAAPPSPAVRSPPSFDSRASPWLKLFILVCVFVILFAPWL